MMKERLVILLAGILVAFNTHAQTPAFLTNGLVGYWPFNGNANDASGNGLNGTVYNATLATDRFGHASSCYSFTGSNNCYISVASTPALELTTNLTISLWMKKASFPWGAIVCKGDGEDAYSVGMDTQTNIAFSKQNISYMAVIQPGTLANNWLQVVCTLNGTNACLYFNGRFVTNGMGLTLGTGTGALTFGTILSGTPGSYAGLLDDVRIYNRPLSASEVAQLYAYESGVLKIEKAVYVDTASLTVGSNYQFQVSSDLVNWTNQGPVFTATNTYWRATNYWDVANWSQLFFRLVPQ